MKRYLFIIIGIFAMVGIVAIVKNSYILSFGDTERIDKGWTAYENNDYSYAISQLAAVDLKKNSEIIFPLADSYIEIGESYNAIQILKEAYGNKVYTVAQQSQIAYLLGIAYTNENEYGKARMFLIESVKLGNQNSYDNLQIIDSLESIRSK